VQHVGPLVSLYLTTGDVTGLNEYRDVRRHCNFQRYIAWQHELQRLGVYCHPNQFEPMFLSTAHSAEDIDEVLARCEDAADRLAS
jgi:glutamate-1-semialdehyde 2,1-aminomutase